MENAPLFYGVRFVVYSEGDTVSPHSLDRVFWGVVFQNWLPTERVHIKPIGNKRSVKTIARKIVSKNLQNTLAAMDLDYDGLTGKRINHHRVIYTSGYACENDLFSLEIIEDVAAALLRQMELTNEQRNSLRSIANETIESLGRPCMLDLQFSRSGRACLKRDRPGQCIQPAARPGQAPVLNRLGLMSQIREAYADGAVRGDRAAGNFRKPDDFVGKIWLHAAFHILASWVRHEAGLKLKVDHVIDLALQAWRGFNHRHAASSVNNHYTAVFQNI